MRSPIVQVRLSPRIGYSLFAAMQLVPDLLGEAQQMRFARAMKAGRTLRRILGPREAFSLVIPILAYAIRCVGRTAMEARG
ncbi:MAG: energy-coupling factor transporter transmembrane protein EcfT, partial [Microvirga sp.]